MLAASLLAGVACDGGGGGSAGAPRSAAGRVAVVLSDASHPQLQQLEQLFRKALEDQAEDVVVESAGRDAARQRQLVEQFAAQGARAIVVVPVDSTTLVPAVATANRAGIPVFTIELPLPGARVTTHVEPDYVAAGSAAAAYLFAFLPKGATTAIVGHAGAHGARELVAGYRRAADSLQGRVRESVAPTGGVRAEAAAAVNAILGSDPDLDGVFALDPESALGAMDAAYDRRRQDLVIVSFGATQPVLDAVREQRPLRIAVMPRPEAAARRLAEVIKVQLGGDPVTPSIKVPVRLVNADSLRAR